MSVSTRPDRGEATRDALLAAARALFAERGYAGVGTEEVVRRAGVTRGARTDHFRDKRICFRAVDETDRGGRSADGSPARQDRGPDGSPPPACARSSIAAATRR